jgi:large conductance mechanosensitive channel
MPVDPGSGYSEPGSPLEYFAPGGNIVRMTGFKNFIMRGNLVELAVAVVIGTQFSGLVKLVRLIVRQPAAVAGGRDAERGEPDV